MTIQIDYTRNEKLTDFGKETLKDRYLQPNEDYQELFARVASYYGSNSAHSQRIYDYMSKLWFMPATPVLSNGGTDRGFPISCFLQECNDSMKGIVDGWFETVWLACRGGGIGFNWSNVRSIGEKIGQVGKSSGVVPFIRVQDALTLAISQGSLRRGSSASYMHISHPEIQEFINIRRPTGGDPNRKALNIHNGVVIDDKFMLAVKNNTNYELIDPHTKDVKEIVKARDLWYSILTARMETGEPYMMFEDNANRNTARANEELGNKIKMSNLCSEIFLPTGQDHLGNERTAVCCLSSLNLETYEEWKDNQTFITDVMEFLDNVIQDFIDKTEGVEGFEKARYSAMRERSVGLGVMGFHSYLQSKMIPFGNVMAKVHNKNIFTNIKDKVNKANDHLAISRGSCPDNKQAEQFGRFLHTMAIAPTASISVICGTTSPSIEPLAANSFTHKTLSGSFTVRNKYLKKLLEEKGKDTPEIWSSINMNEGSVQHLDFLDDVEKDVFKTALEINNQWIVEMGCDRAPFIDQGQSVNLFLENNADKDFVARLHYDAWKGGLKSLYYCRSNSEQRAEKDGAHPNQVLGEPTKYEECLACQ